MDRLENKTGLIVNPQAGRGKAKKSWAAIQRSFPERVQSLQVQWTTPQGAGALAAQKLLQEGVERLLVLGGDGTVHHVVQVLMGRERNVSLGVLPGGTSNDWFRMLNLSGDPVEAFRQVIEGRSEKADVGALTSEGNDGVTYFLNASYTGLMAMGDRSIDENAWIAKLSGGMGAAIFGFLSAIYHFRPTDLTVELNGEKRHFNRVTALLISLGKTNISDIVFFPDAALRDRYFNVLVLDRLRKTEVFRLFAELVRKNIGVLNEFTRAQARQVRIFPRGSTAQEVRADGEEAGHLPAELRLAGEISVISGDSSNGTSV